MFEEVIGPDDVDKIDTELLKESPVLPCNIWGFIKDLRVSFVQMATDILDLKSSIRELWNKIWELEKGG